MLDVAVLCAESVAKKKQRQDKNGARIGITLREQKDESEQEQLLKADPV